MYWDFSNENEKPFLYISFPSLKDPGHEEGPEKRHTGECITFMKWETFLKWEKSVSGPQRPEEYKKLKKKIENTLLYHLKKIIPGVM